MAPTVLPRSFEKILSLLIKSFSVSGVSTPYKKCESAVLGTAETPPELGENPSFYFYKTKKDL